MRYIRLGTDDLHFVSHPCRVNFFDYHEGIEKPHGVRKKCKCLLPRLLDNMEI